MKNACLEAVKAKQWNHALILASHCDLQTYNFVVEQFAINSLPQGSPLWTLYLMYSGRFDLILGFTETNKEIQLNQTLIVIKSLKKKKTHTNGNEMI